MSKHQEYSDEELIDLLLSDDEKSFDELYSRYWSRLYRHALKRMEDEESAREIVQDVFTELWIHRHERKIHTSVAAYLHTAIRYRIMNYMQKEWVRKRYSVEIQLQPAILNNTTEESIFLEELHTRVEKLTAELPPQCKRVFELSRKEYKNNREIASELDISEKTVEFHLAKALRILRLHLRDLVSLLLISFFR
jgi:RNA polymerase sigma-70 factor (family 1)